MQTYDVVVVGGGITGLALAVSLQDKGLRLALVEPFPVELIQDLTKTGRFSAITIASKQFFQSLKVWSHILEEGVSPFDSISTWEKDSFGRLALNVGEQGYGHLGYIIENQVIRRVLWQNLVKHSEVTLITSTQLKQVSWGENEVFMVLEDQRQISAHLLVAADGANSWLRRDCGIPLTFWDYGHHSVVSKVITEYPHEKRAFQIFYPEGILAFLPLIHSHQCFIIWSVSPPVAQRLCELPVDQFNHELTAAFDARLGLCNSLGERRRFPLMARYARNFAAHRLALIGDAAHTIHPLAGQGANLGLMDAAELSSEICRLQSQRKDIGNYLSLRRYEYKRKQAAAMMLAGMQGLQYLFSGKHPMKKFLRCGGMFLLDKCPKFKSHLIKQAMGVANIPS